MKAAGTRVIFLFIASCLFLKRASSPEVSKRSVSFKGTTITISILLLVGTTAGQ